MSAGSWVLLSIQATAALGGMLDWFDSAVEVTVEGRLWERSVALEEIAEVGDGTWCDQMPPEAYSVERTMRVRAHREVEERTALNHRNYTYKEFLDFYASERRAAHDGKRYTQAEFIKHYGHDLGEQKWSVASTDLGTSGRAEREAEVSLADSMWLKAKVAGGQTHHRVEPVEGEWCQYKIHQWKKIRSATMNGTDTAPQWPHVDVDTCSELGCKREGKRLETYTLRLRMVDPAGVQTPTHCTTTHGGWSIDQWSGVRVGLRTPAKKRMGYGLLCSTISIDGLLEINNPDEL